MQELQLVGYGVDTLILNMRYTDDAYRPIKRELAEEIAYELDEVQGAARRNEMAMVSPWSFLGVSLFVEPHGAGRQWRWLLTSRLLTLTVSQGTFNNLIARVRFLSEYLWTEAWTGDALSNVHVFLISNFGEHIHPQVSEVHHLFERLQMRTGIDGKRVSPHYCRCYMATTQLAMGRSPLDVQRQMGHKTLKMTNHYASLTVEQLQKSHEQFSPLRVKDSGINQGPGRG